ncbi:hypothetical protein JD488_02545 [Aeromonas jandaei]|uniref:hypothetical protein n=1 Tax=Aeromonas jandaei TaxID=650 RepID=UPI00191ED448|nr:hypothetical protein [Aeromonas jandaei]MBL0665587.1 hypothetical protein [Aeromonas jandaei]
MNKFYHVGTLARREVTALLHTLTHNTASNAEGILNYVGSTTTRAKRRPRHTLRRVKKALTVGRIPFELTVTGCRIDRGSHQADRYYYDRTLLAQGWQQYDTEEDAWYFGIWIHTEKLETFTYAEGDTSHVIAPNVEAFRAELARLYQYHPQAPAFISIDPEAGVVTRHFEAKPEV